MGDIERREKKDIPSEARRHLVHAQSRYGNRIVGMHLLLEVETDDGGTSVRVWRAWKNAASLLGELDIAMHTIRQDIAGWEAEDED